VPLTTIRAAYTLLAPGGLPPAKERPLEVRLTPLRPMVLREGQILLAWF
jgi:hypothetical protein